MPFGDLPLPVLFLIFLLLFVLIGLYPAWKSRLTKFRRRLAPAMTPARVQAGIKQPKLAGSWPDVSKPLDSYEILIFRRLAQVGGQGLSRKQLVTALYLGGEHVQQGLRALHDRGLLSITVSQWFSIRFTLSEKGRTYAIAQDFIPRVQEQQNRR